MSIIGNRFWKKAVLVLMLSILLGLFCEWFIVNGSETDFQKIRLTPTDVSWELDDEVEAGKTIFSVSLNVTLFNPNSEPFCVTYPTALVQFVNTIAEIDLVNDTETEFHSGGTSFLTVLDYRQINPGTTTNQSASTLHILEEGLTNLPDGNYTFTAYLYGVNTTDFTSDKLHLAIRDGIPTTYTENTFIMSIGIPKVVFISTICTIFIVINLRKRKKE